MIDEIDHERFAATAKFCAYLHVRPDGRVFYVGKGLRRRAHDFSPSRRTDYHRNIVKKYGRESIRVIVVPAANEAEAFRLEQVLIAAHREDGGLANLTDGGEGCSGRAPTPKQLAALAMGRGPGRLSGESLERVRDGLAKGCQKAAAWRMSPKGVEHLRELGAAGCKRLHSERIVTCAWCDEIFSTRSAKARHCSRRCEQRSRRNRARGQ